MMQLLIFLKLINIKFCHETKPTVLWISICLSPARKFGEELADMVSDWRGGEVGDGQVRLRVTNH